MAKRHQGKQKPTYKSLKAQGKVMSPDGDIIKVPKKHVGRGGGKQGVKGDLTVQHRWSGVGSHGWMGGDKIKGTQEKRAKVSAKKTAKRKGMKPVKSRVNLSDAERIKKGEEMSKLYGGWLGKEMPGIKKKKSSRHAPATGKQAVEEFYERVDRAKDRGEPAAKAYHRDKGHKAWRKKAINRHKGNK